MPTVPWSRINTGLLLIVLIAVIAALATRAYGGPLDPPGPPAATLPQVEPRSPIPPVGWDGTSPITIGSSGSYFLTRNLVQVPITIAAENLTFDLNGFTLSGTTGDGITATAGTKRHIVIRNGTLVGWNNGIRLDQATRSTFSDLHISGAATGLRIGRGNVVSRVDSSNNGFNGVEVLASGDFGGSIEESNFNGNSNYGIHLKGDNVAVRDSVIDSNAYSGIYVEGSWNDIADSRMVGNGNYGIIIYGNRNVVVHNHIDGNVGGTVGDVGAGNIIGPISPATGANPAENIGFP